MDEAEDVGLDLDARTREIARRRLVADTFALAKGAWQPHRGRFSRRAEIGLLVVDGALGRRVTVGARRSLELFGAGDVLVPERPDGEHQLIPHRSAWAVLTPARLAVLDREVVARCAAFPGVLGGLAAKSSRHARTLALRLAIAQLPSLETRIDVLLWHLAGRWGIRERDAIVMHLPLSQQMLAELVSARRTSVCAALQALAARGRVVRRPGRRWALHGEPPPEFASLSAARQAA